jgi:hypothetical protein
MARRPALQIMALREVRAAKLELLKAAAASQARAAEAQLNTRGTNAHGAQSLGENVPVHVFQEATARRMPFLL